MMAEIGFNLSVYAVPVIPGPPPNPVPPLCQSCGVRGCAGHPRPAPAALVATYPTLTPTPDGGEHVHRDFEWHQR